jgi:hypothetical protein
MSLSADEKARESLLSLTISTAQDGINSHGFANLVYLAGMERRRTSFVSKLAASLLQPGADEKIDEDHFYSPISKCLVLTPAFFDQIAKKVAQSASVPTTPEGDGSEYDAGEAERARYKLLGVQPGSRFMNISEAADRSARSAVDALSAFAKNGVALCLVPAPACGTRLNAHTADPSWVRP